MSLVKCYSLSGNTPLHFAVIFQHKEAAKALIGKGADVNIANNFGIHTASSSLFSHFQIDETPLQLKEYAAMKTTLDEAIAAMDGV